MSYHVKSGHCLNKTKYIHRGLSRLHDEQLAGTVGDKSSNGRKELLQYGLLGMVWLAVTPKRHG